MVQFGSFETQQEAQKRLDDLKTANGNILGNVSPSVKEVKLPPDNLTVYRTQAGPLESRAAAQSLCNQLASTGSECYVVETAVSTGTPSTPMAAATPATPAMGAAASPALKSPEQLGSITPVASASASSTPAMQSALSRAATQQDSGEVASTPPASLPSEKPTFWSRLNPFSTTPAAKPVAPKPVAVAERLPLSAPVTEVTSAPVAPAVPNSLSSTPSIVAAAATPAPILTAPAAPLITAPAAMAPAPVLTTPVPAPLFAPAPIVAAATVPVIAAPAMAPAPVAFAAPAPVALASPTNFRPRFASSSTKERAAAETQGLAPLSTIAGPDAVALSAPAPTPVAPTRFASATPAAAGDVQVEEAKRVPVTEKSGNFRPRMRPATERSALQPQYQLAAKTAAIPAANPLPSSTTGVRTYWANIGHFANSQAALEFWNSYRSAHPDFPTQRVRVVSSLQSENHGKEEVSLRVGPFAREGFIETLCGSLGKTNTLRCGGITDVGIAAKTTSNQQGYLQGSRYKR